MGANSKELKKKKCIEKVIIGTDRRSIYTGGRKYMHGVTCPATGCRKNNNILLEPDGLFKPVISCVHFKSVSEDGQHMFFDTRIKKDRKKKLKEIEPTLFD